MGILKTFYMDLTDNDLTTSGRQIRLTTTKLEYVQMAVKAASEVFLGEWYRNLAVGVPYLQEILGANVDYNRVETILTAIARDVAYVIDVVDFEFNFDNPSSTYSATLTLLIEGENTGDSAQTATVPIETGV